MNDELDHTVWSALTGKQRHLGSATSRCAAYRRDVSPFAAFASDPVAGDWDELTEIVGPDREVAFTPDEVFVPRSWTLEEAGRGYQLIGNRIASVTRSPATPLEAVHELGDSDVAEMFALIAVARPGPFEPRTILFGDYLGIRRDGALVAMVGARMRIDGWTEISALSNASGISRTRPR